MNNVLIQAAALLARFVEDGIPVKRREAREVLALLRVARTEAAHTQPASEPDLHDFTTHRAPWRKAIEHLAKQDDSGYWKHELQAFDKAMSEFDRATPQPAQQPIGFMSEKQLDAIKDPEGEHGHYIPMRKTPAGNFTFALYATPQPAAKQADPVARDDLEQLQRLPETLREAAAHLIAEPGDRERFERWAGPITALAKGDGKYVDVMTSLAWEAWQAARASLPHAPTKGTTESYGPPRSRPVYLCPDKDIECGEHPKAWCNSCPKRVVNKAEFDSQLWGSIIGWHRAANSGECRQWAKKIEARVRELMEANAEEVLAARNSSASVVTDSSAISAWNTRAMGKSAARLAELGRQRLERLGLDGARDPRLIPALVDVLGGELHDRARAQIGGGDQ
jgi:hypothetical protein